MKYKLVYYVLVYSRFTKSLNVSDNLLLRNEMIRKNYYDFFYILQADVYLRPGKVSHIFCDVNDWVSLLQLKI